MFRILIIFSALLFLLFSCNDNLYETEINKLDSATIKLDSLYAIFNTLDTAKMNKIQPEIGGVLLYIQKYHGDTVEKKTAIVLQKYFKLESAINEINKTYSSLPPNLDYSKNQIGVLRQNLQINKWEKDTGIQYTNDELKEIQRLQLTVNNLKNDLAFAYLRYDSLSPIINILVSQIDTVTSANIDAEND